MHSNRLQQYKWSQTKAPKSDNVKCLHQHCNKYQGLLCWIHFKERISAIVDAFKEFSLSKLRKRKFRDFSLVFKTVPDILACSHEPPSFTGKQLERSELRKEGKVRSKKCER